MRIYWKKLILQTSLWLATEILLTAIGVDDLADYGEFQSSSKDLVEIQMVHQVV